MVFQKSGNDQTLSRSLYQVLLCDLKYFSRRNVHISNSPNHTFDFDPNEQKNFKNEPNLIFSGKWLETREGKECIIKISKKLPRKHRIKHIFYQKY